MATDLNSLKSKIRVKHSEKLTLGDQFKKALKYRFFLYVNFILITAVLFLSLGVRLNQTVVKAKDLSPGWFEVARTFLDLNEKDRQNSVLQIKQEARDALKPIGNFTLTNGLIEAQIDELDGLFQEWLTTLKPLLVYRFSPNGLISSKNSEDYFTNDLEKILNNLPPLLLKTEQKWDSVSLVRWALKNFGTARIKFALQLVDDSFAWIKKIYPNRDQILQILGNDTRQRILIFNQNIGEARPTGGFIGSYIPIELFKGRLTIGESQSIYNVDGSKPKPLLTHPANWYYALDYNGYGESGIRNINYFQCFPSTASALQREFATSSQGFSADIIVFLNPQLLQSLWPDNLTIQTQTVGEINRFNFLEQVEKLTSPSLLAKDDKNPKAEISVVAEALINNFSKVLDQQSSSELATIMGVNLLARNLQIWFKNSLIQGYWEETGLASTQTCEGKSSIPTVSFLLANLSSDKRNLISKNQFSFYSESVLGGHNIHFTYQQIIPDSPDLLRGFNSDTPLTFVGLQIPKDATKLNVSGNNVLKLPALRQNFMALASSQIGSSPKLLEEAKIVEESMSDLETGFVYFQPDGSQVIGAYIRDTQASKTKFSFFIPNRSGAIKFYSQPGMVNTSLSLGEGVEFKDFPSQKYLTKQDSIAIGTSLILTN